MSILCRLMNFYNGGITYSDFDKISFIDVVSLSKNANEISEDQNKEMKKQEQEAKEKAAWNKSYGK